MKRKLPRTTILYSVALLFLILSAGSVEAAGDYWDDSPDYLYYIEGTGSYFLPSAEGDIFFNRGKWYRQAEGSWSMGDGMDGPWSGITKETLPMDLAELPPDFKTTRKLGMIPSRYVLGEKDRPDEYWYRYYRGRFYDNYGRHGYRRYWHPHGGFWFFVAPDFFDDGFDDGHHRRPWDMY